MRQIDKIILARNEVENVVSSVQRQFDLSEEEMMIACEMVLSTARHKALTRGAYNCARSEQEIQEEPEKIKVEEETPEA